MNQANTVQEPAAAAGPSAPDPARQMARLGALAAVSDVPGFRAGVAHCGLKADRPDVMVLVNEGPAPTAAAVFTRNTFAAAPVHVSRQHVANGDVRALVVNAGLANACTGRQGLRDALTMTRETADILHLDADQVLVASTGIIGRPLPMDDVVQGIHMAATNLGDGADAPRAILTTDSGPKTTRRRFQVGDRTFTMAGFAKGAGMIHPDMATMLAFIMTDAPVDARFLADAMGQATDRTFNQISVDGDPSTNDMAAVMASGSAGGAPIDADTPGATAFTDALAAVCEDLATQIAADGEGATRLIEVTVNGTSDVGSARKAARAIVSSFLVKTAVHGADANWGRILAAAGSTGVPVDESSVRLTVSSNKGEARVLDAGSPTGDDGGHVMDAPTVTITLDLGNGPGTGQAWGSDTSPDSVSFNATKTT